MGGALRRWKGSGAVPQANEKGHGRCFKQGEGVWGRSLLSIAECALFWAGPGLLMALDYGVW